MASEMATAASAANGYTSSGRRNKWGAIMEVKEEPPKPQKKRRSRWEEVPEENTDTTLAVVPKEITICGGIRVSILTSCQAAQHAQYLTSCTGLAPSAAFCPCGPQIQSSAACRGLFSSTTGMQVYLPSALTGGPQSSDPKVRELNNELNEVNRKILNNDLEIPPEGERSPSPEPIYDRNGMHSWWSSPPSLISPASQKHALAAGHSHARQLLLSQPS